MISSVRIIDLSRTADMIIRKLLAVKPQEELLLIADTETQTTITGYEVTYRYRGQVLTTRLSYHPGRRLAVNVDVVPLP